MNLFGENSDLYLCQILEMPPRSKLFFVVAKPICKASLFVRPIFGAGLQFWRGFIAILIIIVFIFARALVVLYILSYILYISCIFARVWVVEPAASGKQHFLSLFNNRDSHPCHQKYLKNNLRPWVQNKYCLQFSYFMKCGAVLKTFVNKEKTFVGNFHCGDVHCPLQRPFFNFRNRNLIQFHFLPLSSIVF